MSIDRAGYHLKNQRQSKEDETNKFVAVILCLYKPNLIAGLRINLFSEAVCFLRGHFAHQALDMADPFSIAAGTISIVDVCVRLTKYIHDKKEALKKIGGEIQQLEDEIGSFQEINTSVGKSFQNWKNNSSEPPAVAARIELYWELVGKSLQSCETTLKRLEGILHEIHQGSGSTIVSKRDAFTKDSRKRARQEDLRLACGQLATCQRGLQILLHLIEL